MRAETIGLKKGDTGYYADTPVKYAMRVTNSGEFLHTAPWSVRPTRATATSATAAPA